MPITDPTDIADLSLWLRADSLSLSDGDFVHTWTDESANARSFEQAADGNSPIFQTNDINGLPSVEFGAIASDDYLETASAFDALGGLFNSGGDAVTIFLVQYQAGSQANHGNVAWHTFGAHITYSDSIYFDAANNTTGRINVAQPGGWDDAFHIIELYRSGSSGEINVDNSNLLSSSFSASLGSVTTTMVLGRYASTYFKGKYAEIVFYARALTSGQRTDVYNYLHAKYFEAGGGDQTATLPQLAAAGSLYAPTVVPAALTLTLPRIEATESIYAPTVNAGAVTAVLPAISADGAAYAPTVAPGTVTETLPLIGATGELYAPTVVEAGTTAVLPQLAANGAFYSPTIIFDQTLTLPQLAAAGALYAPSVVENLAAGIRVTLSNAPVLNLTLADASVLTLTASDDLAEG